MAKIKATFKHYEALVKRGEGGKARWVVIGTFGTIDECHEAGATKCKPRFLRS